MPDPKNRLRIRAINTVGFVDKGDDPVAEIVFWKRAPTEESMDTESRNLLQKIYDAVTKKGGDTDTPSGDIEMAEFKKEDLSDEARAAFDALEAEVAELKVQVETPAPAVTEEPDVLKSLPDEQREAIEKRIAATEARVEKAEAEAKAAREQASIEKRERRMAAFRKSAETDHLNVQGSTEEVAEMLFAVEENLEPEMAKRVTDALKAASAQIGENSGLLGEIGKHGGDLGPDSPAGQLEKIAKEKQAADGITYEQAFDRVLDDPANRRLVEASRKQQ
jgi:hypothetical protein